jgi:hypothetical protein
MFAADLPAGRQGRRGAEKNIYIAPLCFYG